MIYVVLLNRKPKDLQPLDKITPDEQTLNRINLLYEHDVYANFSYDCDEWKIICVDFPISKYSVKSQGIVWFCLASTHNFSQIWSKEKATKNA